MDHKEKDSQSGRNSYRNPKDKRNISEGTMLSCGLLRASY